MQHHADGPSLRVLHERDAIVAGIEPAMEEFMIVLRKQLELACVGPLLEEMIALAGDRENQIG